jgi:S1-C subfamily serine protease
VLGITTSDSEGRVVVDQVRRGSRADATGLVRGDVIVRVNGRAVRSVPELNAEVIRGADRSSVVLAVARGRFVYTLTFPMESAREESL